MYLSSEIASTFSNAPLATLATIMPATPPLTFPPHDLVNDDIEKFSSCVNTDYPELFDSCEDSDPESESSQATLEDTEIYAQFGYPLQRMQRTGTTNGEGLFEGTLSRGSTSSLVSCSSWSSSSSIAYDMYVERLRSGCKSLKLIWKLAIMKS